MTKPPAIIRTLIDWCDHVHAQDHPRSQSWQHCFDFFQRTGQTGLTAQRDLAALHLGFYLASWGMYRGSGFLLNHSLTVHRGAVDVLSGPLATPLWRVEDVASFEPANIKAILDVIAAIKQAYGQFGKPSDTLVTKILLGTLACVPATDRFFRDGFKQLGFVFTKTNEGFVRQVQAFCRDHESEFRKAQETIQQRHGVHYPPMILIDMYFNRVGFNTAVARS